MQMVEVIIHACKYKGDCGFGDVLILPHATANWAEMMDYEDAFTRDQKHERTSLCFNETKIYS